VDGKITGGAKLNFGTGISFSIAKKFAFEKSFDNSKLLIKYRKVPEKKNDKISFDQIGMYAYDSEMNEISGQLVKMPYTEAEMNNLAYTIDSDGDIYILTEVMKNGKTKRYEKDGTANFDVKLLTVDKGKTDASSVKVELTGKVINQIGFFEGPKGELYVAGYYGNAKKSVAYSTDGMFYFTMDASGELNNAIDVEIPVNIMKQYTSERSQKKMDKKEDDGDDLSMSNMILRNLIVDSDGSVVFVGEKHYSVTTTDSKGNQRTTYYYQNMLMAKLSKDGELLWMNQLPKSQSGGSPRGGMGYKYMQSGDSHYVLFLDHVANVTLGLSEIPKRHSDGAGGYLTGFKVDDNTGKITRFSILDTRNAQGIGLHQFNTSRIVELSANKFALECYKKDKEDIMITIDVK